MFIFMWLLSLLLINTRSSHAMDDEAGPSNHANAKKFHHPTHQPMHLHTEAKEGHCKNEVLEQAYGSLTPAEFYAEMEDKCNHIGEVCSLQVMEGSWPCKVKDRFTLFSGDPVKDFDCAFPDPALITQSTMRGLSIEPSGYLRVFLKKIDYAILNESAHRLFCYLYLGPPPQLSLAQIEDGVHYDCHHICGNNNCLCPKHLVWMVHSDHAKQHSKERQQCGKETPKKKGRFTKGPKPPPPPKAPPL